MDFFNYDNKTTPGKGKILIAEPFLADPNFERSIILLCEHNEEGSFGFVLNKPIEIKMDDILDDLPIANIPLHLGGPVQQNTFHFLHKNESVTGAKKTGNGIYWGGEFDEIKELMQVGLYKENDYKYFLGYSGWGENQLEEEINSGSWIVADKVDPVLIFHTSTEDLWKIALKSLGGRFSVYSNYPVDPSLN
ncbi:MAG: YqgE/AlgH family protein [Cyclobacteriaceae bacterium]|nr:YqgE/AlgH family protein [Cyclobacteriaceae bacterium]